MPIEKEREINLVNIEAIMRTMAFCKPSISICQMILGNRYKMSNDDIIGWCSYVAQTCASFMFHKPPHQQDLRCDRASMDCMEAVAHLANGDEEAYRQHCKMSEQHCWQASMRQGRKPTTVPESMHS